MQADHRRVYLELFALSFISLFLELLVIRWVTADVRAFSVLKSFPLATCCIGMGVGCALPSDKLYKILPLGLVAFAVLTSIIGNSYLSTVAFPTASYNWITVQPELSTSNLSGWLLSFAFFSGLFVAALAGPFLSCLAIGARLGALFRQLPPLQAYSVNVAGALVGILGFSLLCFFNWSPQLLLVVPASYAAFTLFASERLKAVFVSLAAILAAFFPLINLGDANQAITIWSPYQRLDMLVSKASDGILDGDLKANHWPYQTAQNLSPERLERDLLKPDLLKPDERDRLSMQAFRYDFPFRLMPAPDSVLVFGSGLGNDLAAANRAKVKSVTAVELDPAILELGRKYHPEKPYQAANVKAICDDARHFANTTKDKFDLVIFSHLDSHSVLSQSSAIRLDNFIYTRQSIEQALSLVKPNGLLVISFCTHTQWFVLRLYDTISAAAGYRPAAFLDLKHGVPNAMFVLGEAVKNKDFKLPASLADELTPLVTTTKADRVLSDDWPYLYLAPVSFDMGYFLISLEIVLCCFLLGRKVLLPNQSAPMWQLFFLGAGFLLLELQAIARLSLLLGATWLTASVIIGGVLLMILAANFVLIKMPALQKQGTLLYAFLFAALALSYFLPVTQIYQSMPSLTASFVVGTLTVLPLLAASLIFGSRFASVANPGLALGFNLFGSVIGALLEYSSNYLGIQNMLLLGCTIYGLSFLCYRISVSRESVGGDSQL